jgi:phospholipase C
MVLLVVPPFTVFSLSSSKPTTPIRHIVIIMQENHTFDNMFGVFPGLDASYALPLDVCLYNVQGQPQDGCTSPWNADDESALVQSTGLCHSGGCNRAAYDNGSMDGFVYAQQQSSKATNASYAMAYYTGVTLPDYWDLASYFGLNVNFFSSALEYSWPNHLFMFAGQANGCTGLCPEQYNLSFETMADLLNASGISWKYYAGGWKDSWNCNPVVVQNGVPYINSKVIPSYLRTWQVGFDFPRLQTSQSTCHKFNNLNNFATDLAKGYLPSVAWITPPQSSSDHPGNAASWPSGQEYIVNLIDSIESQPKLWASTAIFLTWDDFGGYFDNVVPQQIDSQGYGFRVPLIVISPYVKQGITIAPSQQDFTAFLATIEKNWNLKAIALRDQTVGDLLYMFNFQQTPLQPLILPTMSLATYPLSTCTSCTYGTSQSIQFYPPVSTESPCAPNQIGDPCD